jgi:hypothetical protein
MALSKLTYVFPSHWLILLCVVVTRARRYIDELNKPVCLLQRYLGNLAILVKLSEQITLTDSLGV